MKRSIAGLLPGLTLAALPLAADAGGTASLEPLAFLAGHCWSATFPDGKSVDTHCFEWMNDGQQLRDRHVVRGPNPDYRGEAIYAWQPERQRIEYRYWDSSGGQSAGYVAVGPDGALRFLEDRYVAPNGSVIELDSTLTRPPEGGYRIVTRSREDTGWRDLFDQFFTLADVVGATGSATANPARPAAGGTRDCAGPAP